MLLLVACFVFFEITGNIECVKPRSVNVALETVLAFEDKDNSVNVNFLDNVQNFLSKVKKVVDHKTAQRRSNKHASNVRFTEFVTQLITILKSYQDDDLEDIFAVLDDEIRKYHYKGCKFYELVSDQHLRRSVAQKLDMVKEKPAKVIKTNLDATLKHIRNAKYDAKQSNLLDYIESLYTTDDGQELNKILKNFKAYKYKSKRADMDLIKMVRDGIRFVIFDHYSGLNINTRRDVKAKIEAFFWDDSETIDKAVHSQATVEDTKIVKHNKARDIKTIQDKEFIDKIIKDVTPFNRYENRQRKTKKKDDKKVKDSTKEKVIKKPTKNDDDDTDSEEIPDDSSDSSEKTEILQSDEDDGSSTETELINESNQNQLTTPRIESSQSHSFEKRKEIKDETDISMNKEDVREEDTEDSSRKKTVTPYPKTIKTKLKKRDKLESTTRKRPMHTLWQSEEANLKVTKIPIKNKNPEKYKNYTSEKHNSKFKHLYKLTSENSKEDKKNKGRPKKKQRTRSRESVEEHGIRFILTGRKTTLFDPNLYRVKAKNYIADNSEDEDRYTSTTKRHKKKQKSSRDKISTEKYKTNKKRGKHASEKHNTVKQSKENKSKKSKSNKLHKNKEKSIKKNLSNASKRHKISQKSTQESESTERPKAKKAPRIKHKTVKRHKVETNSDKELSINEKKHTPVEHTTMEDTDTDGYPEKRVKNKKSKIKTESTDQPKSRSSQESETGVEFTEKSLESYEGRRSAEITTNEDLINDMPYMRVSPAKTKKISNYKLSEEGLSIELRDSITFKNRRTGVELAKETKSLSNRINVANTTEKNNNVAIIKPTNNMKVNETKNSTNTIRETKINNTNTNVNSTSYILTNEKDNRIAQNDINSKRDNENVDFDNKLNKNYTEQTNAVKDLLSEKPNNKETTKSNHKEDYKIDVEKVINKTNDKFIGKTNDTSVVNDFVTPKNETINDKDLTENDKLNKETKVIDVNSTKKIDKNDLIHNLIDKIDVTSKNYTINVI